VGNGGVVRDEDLIASVGHRQIESRVAGHHKHQQEF
jgi:hypothetical protein